MGGSPHLGEAPEVGMEREQGFEQRVVGECGGELLKAELGGGEEGGKGVWGRWIGNERL